MSLCDPALFSPDTNESGTCRAGLAAIIRGLMAANLV